MKKKILSAARIAMVLVACILGMSTAIAQNRAISGVVVDQAGVPVIGASVIVVGNSSNGTITDIDGHFSMTVPAGASVTVSSLGYKSIVASIGDQSEYRFVLQEDTESIEETVVIGYGVQKKSDLTGSVASVRSDDLKNRSTSDAAAALQGKAAGVQILNNSGAPGQGAQIRVRGVSSNTNKADALGPLLIVDGLRVDNIQYLDPSMIESMEILKDAASAAIYGAEAGNGVVLITTKTGASNKGRSSITYDFKFTNQRLGKRAEILNTNDYIKYQKAISQLAESDVEKVWDGKQHNWFDAVFEPSWAKQHGITFQGGNNRGNFLAAINYLDNDGIVKGKQDVYKRLLFQFNADYKIKDWLTVGTNNTVEKWSRKSVSTASYGSLFNSVMSLDPLTPPYYKSPDEFANEMKTAFLDNPDRILIDPENGLYYATSKYLIESTGNPLLQRDRTQSTDGGITLRGTSFINFTPLKGIVFTSRLGYRISQGNTHSYSAPYYATSMANSAEYSISATTKTAYDYQWENFLNLNKDFGKHTVGAMAGMSFVEKNDDNGFISAQGVDILRGYEPNFRYVKYILDSATKKIDGIGSNAPSVKRNISYFGRVSYSYDNRYFLQTNFRADAFDLSYLSKQNRWGYFPSFSAGWNISNESFFKDNVSPDAVSFLKFRGSWGQNGNVAVLGNYDHAATIKLNSQWYQYDPATGAQSLGSGPSGLPNPKLTWETSEQIDLGIEGRFFRDRLSASVVYYDKKTKDLLTTIKPPCFIGEKSTVINAGDVVNRGIEIELGWKDHIGDLNYSINANLSTLHNEVTYLHSSLARQEGQVGGVSGLNNKIRTAFEVGHKVWYFRGYKFAGVDSEGRATYYDKNGKVVNSVGDEDLQDIGAALPDVLYGFTINLDYKGFDLSIYGTGTAGNDIFSLLYNADRPKANCLDHYWKDSWTPKNTGAKYPAASIVANDWMFWSSDASLFNGSYLKIKQIQLGYTLPAKISRKALIENLRCFVSLDDFFTFSNYPGCDPETATTTSVRDMGYDCGNYPTTKKIVLGLNITF
ncbi:MAG: TonB-dependent receptor [Candidatus Cryptobacteroides sp.]|nr:TonB-dependent receptor [Candidatus Cryptobacteroides sp.]